MTVGFGDLYPNGTVQYMSISIVFIFIGLVLTTLAVDVSGSVCIDKIHSLGRGFDAMKVLKALKENVRQKSEEAARKGAELRQKNKQQQQQKNFVDLPRWFAYVPKDALTIPYIDESARTTSTRTSL
ncbi:unnamed protein product [Caenorhabditis angaria]|uniref:Potassium channel domain-containing protein n=1 Tax=Caenorhabditis angaria TaxID=860376 RepID=A0A9P1IEV9_9PELO|nr:unnamed protein product [Caenorhabditis angaria]